MTFAAVAAVAASALVPVGAGATEPPGGGAPGVEPCPAEWPRRDTSSAESSGWPPSSELLDETSRLEPMLGQVLAYGTDRPETFAGYGLVWHDVSDASVFIALTGDVAAQRDELLGIVSYPDELIVCAAVLSDVESAELRAEIEPLIDGHMRTLGESNDGAVRVGLDADSEDLAAELVMRYGGRVRVNVGRFPYPMPDPLPPADCDLDDPVEIDGLEVTVAPIDVALGVDGVDADVVLSNVGDEHLSIFGGAATGWLLDPVSGNTVGSFYGAQTAMGYSAELDPGDETTFPILTGIASCDPAIGYRVPPGEYELIARVPLSQPVDGELESEPVIVEVSD